MLVSANGVDILSSTTSPLSSMSGYGIDSKDNRSDEKNCQLNRMKSGLRSGLFAINASIDSSSSTWPVEKGLVGFLRANLVPNHLLALASLLLETFTLNPSFMPARRYSSYLLSTCFHDLHANIILRPSFAISMTSRLLPEPSGIYRT